MLSLLFLSRNMPFFLSFLLLNRVYLYCLFFYFRLFWLFLLWATQTICILNYMFFRRWLLIFELETQGLNSIKNRSYYWFGIKAMNFLMELSVGIMNGGIGKRWTSNIGHTMLRIPCAIEVINLKAPLFLMLQLVDHLLEVATEAAVGWEILYYFKGSFIVDDQLLKLLLVYEVGIGHVPLLGKGGAAKEDDYW